MQETADFRRKYMVSMLSAFETVHCIQADPVRSGKLHPVPFPLMSPFSKLYAFAYYFMSGRTVLTYDKLDFL